MHVFREQRRAVGILRIRPCARVVAAIDITLVVARMALTLRGDNNETIFLVASGDRSAQAGLPIGR